MAKKVSKKEVLELLAKAGYPVGKKFDDKAEEYFKEFQIAYFNRVILPELPQEETPEYIRVLNSLKRLAELREAEQKQK